MSELKFYRGLADKYQAEIHGDGIYFATNTRQIIHAGVPYGISTDINLSDYATKDFLSDSLCGYIRDLEYNEETGEFLYFRKKKILNQDGSYGYSDEKITFSLRNNFIGNIKGLGFENDEEGRGYLSYSKTIEKTEELETGESVTTLDTENVKVEIPEASYKSDSSGKITYNSGLMSGKVVEKVDSLETSVKNLDEFATWNNVEKEVSSEE